MQDLEKNLFRIDNNSRNDCSIYCYINIDKKILIRVTEITEDDEENIYGEYGTDYQDAGIELTKDMAIKLRDELERLIKINYQPTGNQCPTGETCIGIKQCNKQGFCSRCD